MEYTPISIKEVNKQSKGKTYEYFEARTTVTFEDGTKKRKCGTGKTRKDANACLKQKLEELEQLNNERKEREEAITVETTVPVNSSTLNEALEHFLEYRLREGIREATYVRDDRVRRNQIAEYPLGKMHPLKIEHRDILDYMDTLKKEGLSKSTQDKAYSLLRLYFNFIYKDNRQYNPCYEIRIGYAPKVTVESILSTEDVVAMFRACNELKGDTDIFQFAFMTYERPGEVATLKFSDWNKKDKTLKITRTYTENRNARKVVSPDGQTKTESSNRVIRLSEMANNLLIERYEAAYKELGRKARTAYIWRRATNRHLPIEYNALRRLQYKVMDEAGIEKHIKPHGLRHSGITFYGKDRDQFLAISRNAGHSRPSITEDIYSHVLDEHVEAAVVSANRMNQSLCG